MDSGISYRRGLAISVCWHAAIVAALIGTGLWQSCRDRRRPREMVTVVELHAPASTPAPAPPRPDPMPAPPDPAPPPPAPPPPRPRPTVQRSDRRVVREPAPRSPTPTPPTADEIRRQIESALPTEQRRTDPPPSDDRWRAYHLSVQQALYEAWVQPSELSATAGHRPVVRIRVERDGTVSRRDLVRRSGNARMDESVMAAAARVARLRPLPDWFRGSHREIEIEFELAR